MTSKTIKIVGTILTIVSGGVSIASEIIQSKNLDNIIAEQVRKEIARQSKK